MQCARAASTWACKRPVITAVEKLGQQRRTYAMAFADVIKATEALESAKRARTEAYEQYVNHYNATKAAVATFQQ